MNIIPFLEQLNQLLAGTHDSSVPHRRPIFSWNTKMPGVQVTSFQQWVTDGRLSLESGHMLESDSFGVELQSRAALLLAVLED